MKLGKRAAVGAVDVAKLAAGLRREVEDATHALVGPALVYGGETLSLMVVLGNPGREGWVVSVDLGTFEPDPEDDALCAAADTVLWLRRPDGITKREADACRQELVQALRRRFRHVEACEDDLSLAEANLRWFPCGKAELLLADVRAEMAGPLAPAPPAEGPSIFRHN
jgi:hypothetical protein